MAIEKISKLDIIYKKYYSDVNYDIYISLIANVDPTTPFRNNVPDKMGQYSQWLLVL